MKQKLKFALPVVSGRWPVAGGTGRAAGTALVIGVWLLLPLLGCEVERRKSDTELGLTPNQAVGRGIFDRQCGGCHEAYSSRAHKGPTLQGLFKHPYLQNGMPANDDRVRDIVVNGRAKMPGFSRSLTSDDVERLMEYLHTI